MNTPPIPENEQSRMNALLDFLILDTPSENAFDLITKLAASICEVPTSIITFVDRDRQWFKSTHNLALDSVETSREVAFCSYTILNKHIMEVCDAKTDPRFKENPLVLDKPNIRFYAGAPLTTQSGYNLGSLCVLSSAPKVLTEAQKSQLTDLANITMLMLDIRKNLTNQQEKNWRIEENKKIKDEIFANMSHELLTPLNAIAGFSQLLELELENNKQSTQYEYVRHISERSQFISKMIENMLELSGAKSGGFQFNPEPTDVESQVKSAASDLDRILRSRAIGLSIINNLQDNKINSDPYWVKRIANSCLLIASELCRPYASITIRIHNIEGGYFVMDFLIKDHIDKIDNYLKIYTDEMDNKGMLHNDYYNINLNFNLIHNVAKVQGGDVRFFKNQENILLLSVKLKNFD